MAAHVMAAAARGSDATGMEPLYEKEEVMRRAANKLVISLGKLGIGSLKRRLAARGRRDLASQVGKLKDVRKVVAHPGCLAEAVSQALKLPEQDEPGSHSGNADGSSEEGIGPVC